MTIPIVYFRSFSYNSFKMCQQQYFLDYILGWAGPSGKKADKGTIVHKVLETLAIWKKENDNGQRKVDCNLSHGVLDSLVERTYNYYTKNLPHHTSTNSHFTDCRRGVNKALEFNNGMFDPRNRTIVAAEPHFDFVIEEEWAKYQYDGQCGYLAMKGTIDLITDLGDNVYEIIDWKTGQRKDWSSGNRKEQSTLINDPQLRIYHLAAKELFPHVKSFIITINYINDGGTFTIHLGDENIEYTKKLLKDRFEEIKNTRPTSTSSPRSTTIPSRCTTCRAAIASPSSASRSATRRAPRTSRR